MKTLFLLMFISQSDVQTDFYEKRVAAINHITTDYQYIKANGCGSQRSRNFADKLMQRDLSKLNGQKLNDTLAFMSMLHKQCK